MIRVILRGSTGSSRNCSSDQVFSRKVKVMARSHSRRSTPVKSRSAASGSRSPVPDRSRALVSPLRHNRPITIVLVILVFAFLGMLLLTTTTQLAPAAPPPPASLVLPLWGFA